MPCYAAMRMNYLEIALIGIALAADAMAYSFSYGLVLRTHRMGSSLWLALVVGLFQAGMPLIGYGCGSGIRTYASAWGCWLAVTVFVALGGGIICHAWQGKNDGCHAPSPLGFSGLMLAGLATSIDALAVGACLALGKIGGNLATLWQLGFAVSIIGLITAAGSLASFHAARLLHRFPARRMETLAGLLLIGLGLHHALLNLGMTLSFH